MSEISDNRFVSCLLLDNKYCHKCKDRRKNLQIIDKIYIIYKSVHISINLIQCKLKFVNIFIKYIMYKKCIYTKNVYIYIYKVGFME